MTPNALQTREAWMRAHAHVAKPMFCLALYYLVTGIVGVTLSLVAGRLEGAFFNKTFLPGMVVFVVLAVVAEKKAAEVNRS